ncbi:MAG: hypothetical protein M3124_03150 [Actinomycetota bacterium]|nr:hypothetical protein [Actinomycetota bacterium]
MDLSHADEAVAQLEKANANLELELLAAAHARELLASYTRPQRLAALGIASLARKAGKLKPPES